MAQGLHLLNTIIFTYVYWYMKQISGERLQDHWSSGLKCSDIFNLPKGVKDGRYKNYHENEPVLKTGIVIIGF